MHPWLVHLSAALEDAADPVTANGQQAYMRDRFPFYGIKTPERRARLREHVLEHGRPELEELPELVHACWALPQREYQYIGMELLSAASGKLRMEHLPLIEELILTKSWWDTVDHLAVHAAGAVLLRNRDQLEATNEHWLGSGELWLLRTALIAQLSWKERTQADILFRNCAALATHPDFFIRKGIGWALRQYARTDPMAVADFVGKHSLSPLSEREALRRDLQGRRTGK
jgi:3-methyladenine DNA glycosylase AlkD